MRRTCGFLVSWSILVAACLPATLAAQQPAEPGSRVVIRDAAVLRGDDEKPARGDEADKYRIYKVERVDGARIRVVSEPFRARGWVQADDVIPLDQADAYITALIQDQPDAVRLYIWRGRACEARNELDRALDDFDEAIRIDPRSAPAHVGRGIIWGDKQDPDKAVADFSEAIRLDPRGAPAYVGRGNALNARKEYDKAVADLNEAVRLDPGDPLAYSNRGYTWIVKKEYDKAIADLNEVIRLNPDDALAFHNRGDARSAKKEYDKAVADLNEAIRLTPDDALAYKSRGFVWRDKREYDKAIADFEEADRLDTGDSWPRLGIALTRLMAGQAEVVADARSVIETDDWTGTNAIYAAILGHIGARRDKQEEASKGFLDDADRRADRSLWPYPIVKYLRREIGEKALLALSTDDDKMTETRCYLAFDQLLNGRVEEAGKNFRWVKEHGTPNFVEVGLAAAELERLDKRNPGAKR